MGRRIRGLPWYLGVLMLAGCEVFEATNTGTAPGPSTTTTDTGPRTSTGTKPPATTDTEPRTTTGTKPRTTTPTKPRKTPPPPPSPAPSSPQIVSQKPMSIVAACLAERWGTAFPNLIVAPAGKGVRVSVSSEEGANLLFEAQIQPSGKGSKIILGDLASNKEPLIDQAVRDAKSCAV